MQQHSDGSKSLYEIANKLYGVVRLHSKEEVDFQYFHEKIRKHFSVMYSNDLIKPLEPFKEIIIPEYNIRPIMEELLLRYLDEERIK